MFRTPRYLDCATANSPDMSVSVSVSVCTVEQGIIGPILTVYSNLLPFCGSATSGHTMC